MRITETAQAAGWTSGLEAENPFAEALVTDAARERSPVWQQGLSPFADTEDEAFNTFDTEAEELIAEALDAVRDEDFHEAVATLAEETEQAVSERFSDETPLFGNERERFAETYLAGASYEAEQYLAGLETGLTGIDTGAMTSEQFDQFLDQFDPSLGELTPAGEEFVGKFIKKAKSAVKFVASAAKKAGKLAMPFLGPLLKKLAPIVKKLMQRVLKFAIGRLPEGLRPAAQTLADKMLAKAQKTVDGVAGAQPTGDAGASDMAPAMATDVEALVDSFDANLAEAMAFADQGEAQMESFDTGEHEVVAESRDLELLAEARGRLIDQIALARDEEDLAPAIEQFVPAIMTALRLGLKLTGGRAGLVKILSNYLAKFISRWVQPDQAAPLANAIVDTGLKLISLEAEDSGHLATREAAPVALASVIEDTVRRFAENEAYVLENEDLSQLAAAEAFAEAIATHFPQSHVRDELQLAPSLGGTFVTRNPRSVRSYSKYSRTPEIEVSARAANSIPAFGGSSLGATMRAAGAQFPIRARVHMYQAKAGSTVGSMMRHDRKTHLGPRNAFPLTPGAAGTLLREPGLGVAVPNRFLRSRNHIAAGQRILILEPLDSASAGRSGRRGLDPGVSPGRAWISVNARKNRIMVGIYLSDAEAQKAAEAIRQGAGSGGLLRALVGGFKSVALQTADAPLASGAQREDGEDFEDFALNTARFMPQGFKFMLRQRIGKWVLPAIAKWVRENSEAFLRAAAHPDPGVIVRVRLSAVPGISGGMAAGKPVTLASLANALRGTPAISVSVAPGKQKA